jgi:hypothetical protein
LQNVIVDFGQRLLAIGVLRTFVENHGWLILWMGCGVAFLIALRQTFKRQDNHEGKPPVFWKILDWSLFLITLAGALGAQFASETSDKRINNLEIAHKEDTNALVKLQEKYGPRAINEEQERVIIDALKASPKGVVLFSVVKTDPECAIYRRSIMSVMSKAGFTVDAYDVAAEAWIAGPPIELNFWVIDPNDPPRHALPILEAFRKAKIPISRSEQRPEIHSVTPPPKDVLEIRVGSKSIQ